MKKLVLFVILCFVSIPYVFAYDTSELNLTWTNYPSAVIFDVDQDGYADQLYTYNQSGQDMIFTKIFGNGTSSATVTMPTGYSFRTITVDENIVYVSSSRINPTTTCSTNVGQANILTGAVTNSVITDSVTDTLTITDCFVSAMKGKNNETIISTYADGGTAPDNVRIKNSTTTIFSSTLNVNGNYWYGNNFFAPSNNFSPIDSDYNVYAAITPDSQTAFTTGMCDTIKYCMVTLSNSTSQIKPSTSPTATSVIADTNLFIFQNGVLLPRSSGGMPTKLTYWNDYLSIFDGTNEQVIATLPYKILDSSLSSEALRFIFNDGTDKYVFYGSGTGVKSTPITSTTLTDRSYSYYVIDTDPPAFSTDTSDTLIDGYSLYYTTPSTPFTQTTQGVISLVSGYQIGPLSTVSRTQNPTPNNSTQLIPYIVGPTASLTQLSAIVKNAPSSAGFDVRDSILLDSVQYSWSMDLLGADKSLAVDLPYPKCVTLFIKDLSDLENSWINLGNVCNTGSMPKTIVYSDNLTFTFWSLPYGVSHSFIDTTSLLSTKVRHDTLPYNYTVKIYDSANILQYDNEFMETTSEIDNQVINATGISKPATLRVYDIDGNQLYYASIGTPSYFSNVVAWFSTWMTIQSFNILFLLPIVFSAMFTRNTVGIGTTITVVFTATLTWLGIIPLPDVAIYFMIVIAIIGMIAHKKLYD